MRKIIPGAVIAIVCCIALSGCSKPPLRFSKLGADQQTFMQDRYICIQEARKQTAYADTTHATMDVKVDGGVFTSCMGAKGYTIDPNGPLTAPPGTEIRAVN